MLDYNMMILDSSIGYLLSFEMIRAVVMREKLCKSLIVEGISTSLTFISVKSMQSFKASLDNSLVYFKIQI